MNPIYLPYGVFKRLCVGFRDGLLYNPEPYLIGKMLGRCFLGVCLLVFFIGVLRLLNILD